MPGLLVELEAYDGKHTAELERIRDELPVSPSVMVEAITLATHDQSAIAAGASWLWRAWLEGGAPCGARLLGRLAMLLPRIVDHWAQLHVCQAMRSLEVPAAQAVAFAKFFDACCRSRRPLLRAWGMDALHRLALVHLDLEPLARQALERGADDPAASVRARLRRIQNGD